MTIAPVTITCGLAFFVSIHAIPSSTLAGLMGYLAIGLGLGYISYFPGTAGALLGIIIALALDRLRPWMQLLTTVVLVALAVPICEYGAREYQGSDKARIVADEALTFPVATVALPVRYHPALLAGVFIISRVLDSLKPPPARAVEKLPGGIGIVYDDVVVNAWTLLFGLIGWEWYHRRWRNMRYRNR
ncbi:phosphatidylglycerophosphatase A [Nitrosococcus wardiae]|uniref:phosphatidylglycerophosphatase A family protein n=1 Tax=Nitrosococcus wardiae TaxID=1814290 RepID=UPI00141BF150|nr:phosphatidylglycerophosphatase A [Nitrosococcus wardiae]